VFRRGEWFYPRDSGGRYRGAAYQVTWSLSPGPGPFTVRGRIVREIPLFIHRAPMSPGGHAGTPPSCEGPAGDWWMIITVMENGFAL